MINDFGPPVFGRAFDWIEFLSAFSGGGSGRKSKNQKNIRIRMDLDWIFPAVCGMMKA